MALSPRIKARSGVSPEWANLPRRRCSNCGKSYKPKRPLRPDEKHGFCQKQCKDQFHKHGGAYAKLRDEMLKMVAREIGGLEKRLREIVREELGRATVYGADSRGGIIPFKDPLSDEERDALHSRLMSSPAAHRANR